MNLYDLLMLLGCHTPSAASFDIPATVQCARYVHDQYRRALAIVTTFLLPAKRCLDGWFGPEWPRKACRVGLAAVFMLNVGLVKYRSFYSQDLAIPAIEYHAQSEGEHLSLRQKLRTCPSAAQPSMRMAVAANEDFTRLSKGWMQEDEHFLAVLGRWIFLTSGVFISLVRLLFRL